MKSELELFRLLIILLIVGTCGGLMLSWNIVESVNYDQLDLFDWVGHGALISHQAYLMLFIVSLVFQFLGLLGLVFFIGFGRWLFLFSLLLGIPLGLLGGYYVITPVESGVYAVIRLISSFVLGMAFFSRPVLARFRSNRRSAL